MATATTVKAPAKVLGEGKLLETGARFYVVASQTCAGANYLVTWNGARAAWGCNCAAGQHGRSCSHVTAVNAHLTSARRPVAQPVTTPAPAPTAQPTPSRPAHETAPLYRSNEGFSIWKR